MRGIAFMSLVAIVIAVVCLAGCGGGSGPQVGTLIVYDGSDETRPVVDPLVDIHQWMPFFVAPEGMDIGAFDPAGYTFTVEKGALIQGAAINRFRSEVPGEATIVATKGGETWKVDLVVHPFG